MLGWFNAREATALGTALADQFASGMAVGDSGVGKKGSKKDPGKALVELLRRADAEIRKLRLNFYKKAKLANTFKWRLLEKGVERHVADEITQSLVMHVSMNRASAALGAATIPALVSAPGTLKARDLGRLGDECMTHGDYAQAISHFGQLISLRPRDAEAHQALGVALCKAGRFQDAEICFTRAIGINPKLPVAHANLGNALRVTGRLEKAENSLRRALKLRPSDEAIRTNLGTTLQSQGRSQEAKAQFAKVLKTMPRNVDALVGIGRIAAIEGNFAQAETYLKRALEVDPDMPSAWASLVGLRKMTPGDAAWLSRVKEIAGSDLDPVNEANLRYAMGKYHDDVEEFDAAFENFQRANKLMKGLVREYPREAHENFIDDLMRVYTRDIVTRARSGGSDSTLPVLVVGMPRSGTSLVEQIIASHPAAQGAGELTFWTGAVRDHEAAIRQGLLDESTRKKLAHEYLKVLGRDTHAQRIVDKAPANTEYLGLIHSVFPNARIIHMQRDPIDTCLSCYFQQFSTALNFTFDLSDLVHYYRQFHRIMAHWRAVLPEGTILDVPYEQLVADQETWTRRIIDFLGLPWDERCLSFHTTSRSVATASAWQVRQKIYRGSVARWRSYARHIGPLQELKDLA